MAVFSSTQVGMLIVLTAIAVLYQVELDYDPLIVQEKAVVARSPEDVFKFMSDIFNYPEWTGIIKRIVPLDDSSLGVGKTFHMHMSVPIGLKRYHTVVQSYKPGSLLALTIDMEFLHPTVVIEVNEDERPGMSKVTMKVYSSRRSYLFRGTLLPISKFVITGHLQGALFHMKLLMQQ
ncbi:uncharacterized protein [Asterias amurensis]|uniref:uncharacterized protein n=1 Tax=Asterias amurensis TaxID=7602 RepID=UPI003AB8D39A